MVCLETTPELVILAIIRQMTLKDKMVASQVCRRWNDLVGENGRRRQQMTIQLCGWTNAERIWGRGARLNELSESHVAAKLTNANGTPTFANPRITAWNALKFTRLNDFTVGQICDIFSDIKQLQLVIVAVPDSQLPYIVKLLSSWQHQLTSLKIVEEFGDNARPRDGPLFALINAMPSLTHLHLDLYRMQNRQLPIISRLESINFYSQSIPPRYFGQMLAQYGQTNHALNRIGYKSENEATDDALLQLAELVPEHLRLAFTHLEFARPVTNIRAVTQFAAIQRLRLRLVDSFSTAFLYRQLSQLPELLYLNLDVNMNLHQAIEVGEDENRDAEAETESESDSGSGGGGGEEESDDDQQEEEDEGNRLAQLQSLKGLYLYIVTNSHMDIQLLNIPWAMPNVEIIYLHFGYETQCTHCGIGQSVFSRPALYRQQMGRCRGCFGQVFAPLKENCTKLLSMDYFRSAIFGSVDELVDAENV